MIKTNIFNQKIKEKIENFVGTHASRKFNILIYRLTIIENMEKLVPVA